MLMPETEIKHLMKYLGESIHEILADSPKIHEHIQKIREAGYEVFLVIEAKAGLSDKKEEDDETHKRISPKRSLMAHRLQEKNATLEKLLMNVPRAAKWRLQELGRGLIA